MEQKLNIYIIIVTYNGMKWIEKALSCLRLLTYPVKTLVIDNCSTDGTREFIPSHFPEVIWLPQEKNVGFGKGNNIGMKYALEHSADYVLLLNQDAYLQPTSIEEMLKVSDGYNLVSPIHLCGDGSRFDFMFRESIKKANIQIIDDLIIKGACNAQYDDIGEVCAACWFLPISILKEVGGFNPLFFQYGEDNNYYTRLVYHGRKTILSTKAFVWHDRKIHGNAQLFQKKYIHLRTLVTACDINLSFVKRLKKWIGVWIESPIRFPVEFIKLIPNMLTIEMYKRKEKKKQPNWL